MQQSPAAHSPLHPPSSPGSPPGLFHVFLSVLLLCAILKIKRRLLRQCHWLSFCPIRMEL
nr:MAG TPA: hypothetical protein [Caudoviricetes sp.]